MTPAVTCPAVQAAAERIGRPRVRRVQVDAELRAVVVDLLSKRWSPEQVAHELLGRFADQPARRLCTESIYQAVYDPDMPVTRPPSAAVGEGVASRA